MRFTAWRRKPKDVCQQTVRPSETNDKETIMAITLKQKYFKAHDAQVNLLLEANVQLDTDGYPLCSSRYLEKMLSDEQLLNYDHLQDIKDALMKQAMDELTCDNRK